MMAIYFINEETQVRDGKQFANVTQIAGGRAGIHTQQAFILVHML
jgi:hypothetical protein